MNDCKYLSAKSFSKDVIFLYAIVKSVILKRYGIKEILKPFNSDIRVLRTEGISINVDGQEMNFKGSLLFAAGDTPAAAAMGGFKESVAAYRPCRTCYATQNQWRLHFHERHFFLRYAETHEEHLEMVSQPNVPVYVKNFWKRRYGVNAPSPFREIEDFDVTQDLPQDIMHVLIEVIAAIVIQAFLRYCIFEAEIFTIEEFNERMSYFDFGHFKLNKPADLTVEQINEGGTLRHSASQIFSLAHALPFLIIDFTDDDEEMRKRVLCYTSLLQILNICFAYEIHENVTDTLSFMIQNFIFQFNELYPNCIVPKFHFLIHIARYILLFGPPRQFSCFRFKGAHCLYKSLVPVVRNFKDMPYTMAYRHQSRLCSRLASAYDVRDKKFLYLGDDISFRQIISIRNLLNAQLLYDHFGDFVNPDLHVMRTPKVVRYETIYKP